MDSFAFHDGNISTLIDHRSIGLRHHATHKLQMHSSMVQRLSFERELEGHIGCVNTIAWNSAGSLLISGSDDTRINIWRYSDYKLLNSVDTGHSSGIFCTKFVPETYDEIVASGAGDAEVRVFNISRLSGKDEETSVPLTAHFQCHTRQVKKLAVEIGNPNVIWSASEDGTLRQHDLREGCYCRLAGASNQECKNVLLDLHGAAKRSLAEPSNHPFQIKSCDISTTRPHLILVGGSDAFARLYDRRMLPPLSHCRRENSPPPCVNYFCPMHLSERGRSSLHLTHVTFSPNGEEILMNYSAEHVYLMDVNRGSGSVQYTSVDVANLSSFSPILDGVNLPHLGASSNGTDSTVQSCTTAQLEKCRKLVNFAQKCLLEGSNYYYGIEACNEVLDGGYGITLTLKHDCLCVRAALLLKRNWKNDAHIAVKDLNLARKIDPCSLRALLNMSKALSQLGKHKEAQEFARATKCDSSCSVQEMRKRIQKQLSAAEDEKSERRAGRLRPLRAIAMPETVIDMKQRYIGHCHVEPGITQASFLGQNGNYVATGSDDGRWFIWEKRTGRLIKRLLGDTAVVNCIQGHPFDSVVATSGIDSTIKIWTPTAQFPSMVAGGSIGPDTDDVLKAMEDNQQRLLLQFTLVIIKRSSNIH